MARKSKSWRDRYVEYEKKCQQAAFKTGNERKRAYQKLEVIRKELWDAPDLPESLRPRLAIENPATVDGIQARFETELAVFDLVGIESEDIKALRDWRGTDFGSKYQPRFHKGEWNRLADRLIELTSVPLRNPTHDVERNKIALELISILENLRFRFQQFTKTRILDPNGYGDFVVLSNRANELRNKCGINGMVKCETFLPPTKELVHNATSYGKPSELLRVEVRDPLTGKGWITVLPRPGIEWRNALASYESSLARIDAKLGLAIAHVKMKMAAMEPERRTDQSSQEHVGDAVLKMRAIPNIAKNESGKTKEVPPERLSKPISKKKAVKFLGKTGDPKRNIEWLNKCIRDGTIWHQPTSRQSGRYDLSEFPESSHQQMKP